VSEFITAFNAYAKDYPMIAGAFSLWVLGIVSWFGRSLPGKIWGAVRKFSTTTITLTSSSDSFFLFLRWYQDKGYAKKGRYIKISNGRYGHGDMITSLGYGTHYFWYKRRFVVMTMNRKESTTLEREIDDITMTMLGRSHKIFDDMFKQVSETKEKEGGSVIKRFEDSWWRRSAEQIPRKMDTIFLPYGKKEKLIRRLDDFQAREDWYVKHSIPYLLGILLYGPPGTGKSSVIRAIAEYLNYELHILNSSSLSKIEAAMFNLPQKSLIAIEDLDTDSTTHKRRPVKKERKINAHKTQNPQEDAPPEEEEDIINFSFANLSDILNAINGVHVTHGRILVATTNHIDKLDPALIRHGRIDLRLECSYADHNVIREFFSSFYPDFALPSSFQVKPEMTSAYIQNAILENINDPKAVFEQVAEGQIVSNSCQNF
jgi:chaperone BCS1